MADKDTKKSLIDTPWSDEAPAFLEPEMDLMIEQTEAPVDDYPPRPNAQATPEELRKGEGRPLKSGK